MPRDGANIVADLRVPVLTVSVNRVGRRERHDVESLKREYSGNLKGPDLLAALVADCPKRSFSLYGGLQSKVRDLIVPRSPRFNCSVLMPFSAILAI